MQKHPRELSGVTPGRFVSPEGRSAWGKGKALVLSLELPLARGTLCSPPEDPPGPGILHSRFSTWEGKDRDWEGNKILLLTS